LSDMEDVVSGIIIALRIAAFVIGSILLTAGFASLGMLGQNDIFAGLLVGPRGIVEILVSVVLMLAGIEPQTIGIIIQWIARS
jgi:hypothetical protein